MASGQMSQNHNVPATIEDKPLTARDLLQVLHGHEFQEIINSAVKPLIESQNNRISQLETDHTHTRNLVVAQGQEITRLKNDLLQMKQSTTGLQQKVGIQERNERLKHLKVTGLQGTNPMELANNFVNLAKTSLALQLSTDEFAVRMSVKMPARSATIVFSNYWKRTMCYDRRTQLKGSNIFITEDLNPEESKLFYECRQLRKRRIIQNTWTRNNKIYIRRSFNSDSQQIDKISDLDQLNLDPQPTAIPRTDTNSPSTSMNGQPIATSSAISTRSSYHSLSDKDSTPNISNVSISSTQAFNGFTAKDILTAQQKHDNTRKELNHIMNNDH